MISISREIGLELSKLGFKKNKFAYKVRGENYHSSYIRLSQDSLYVHLASVAVYCRLPHDAQEIYLAPLAVTIEAGVELRAAVPELYRPAGARDEMNLSSTDCTFRVSEKQIQKAIESMNNAAVFKTTELRALTMLPTSADKTERIEELLLCCRYRRTPLP